MRPLGASHQGPIDYIGPKSIRSTTMDTHSGRPSKITPYQKTQSPYIIPSDEESICYKPPLPTYIDINYLPPPPTKVPPTEPSNKTLHKNLVEPLSIHTLNLMTMGTTCDRIFYKRISCVDSVIRTVLYFCMVLVLTKEVLVEDW